MLRVAASSGTKLARLHETLSWTKNLAPNLTAHRKTSSLLLPHLFLVHAVTLRKLISWMTPIRSVDERRYALGAVISSLRCARRADAGRNLTAAARQHQSQSESHECGRRQTLQLRTYFRHELL